MISAPWAISRAPPLAQLLRAHTDTPAHTALDLKAAPDVSRAHQYPGAYIPPARAVSHRFALLPQLHRAPALRIPVKATLQCGNCVALTRLTVLI